MGKSSRDIRSTHKLKE